LAKSDQDFRQRVLDNLTSLTEGQRAVGDYIMSNYDEVAFMTAARVGREAGVSETTVMRFTSSLGYEGWPELQRALHDDIRSRLTTVERLRGSSASTEERETVMTKVMTADIQSVRDTMRTVTEDQFAEAVSMILQARQIRVVGVRSVAPLASYFAMCLNWILNNAQPITYSTEDWVEHLVQLSDEDLVIGLTFPRYAALTRDIIRYCKQRGCRVLAVSDGLRSPIARHADLLLVSSCSLESFVDSYVAPLSLVNALVTAVARSQEHVAAQHLAELEKGWQMFGIFHDK